MPRDSKIYLTDILVACNKIEKYTLEMDYDAFLDNDLVVDAVIKNILVIGEAVKSVTSSIRADYPEVEWRKMTGMRDMSIHGYFSINHKIVLDVVENKIPELKTKIRLIVEETE